jgi:adenylate kinase
MVMKASRLNAMDGLGGGVVETVEKRMIELISADVFAVAEREAAQSRRTRDLIHKMKWETFPMNREAA